MMTPQPKVEQGSQIYKSVELGVQVSQPSTSTRNMRIMPTVVAFPSEEMKEREQGFTHIDLILL